MRLLGTSLFDSTGWLTVLAFVAIVALTVVGYVKFLGKGADRRSKGGSFFQFDHFYIEKILKAVYLFSVVCITVTAVVTPFGSAIIASSYYLDFGTVVGSFFGGLVTGILIFLIGQFLCRICFEYSLMFVRLATDARAIRNTVAGEPGAGGAASAQAQAYAPAGSRGAAPSGSPYPQQPVQAPSTWTCPQCGRAGNAGSFCGSCGTPRP